MPYMKWSVEPVFISRHPIPPDKVNLNEFESANNNTLVGVIRQLACLVKISDKIFSELTSECINLCKRTVKLHEKVSNCQSIVEKLNAKTVKVPVGDLNAFMNIENHFKSKDQTNTNGFGITTINLNSTNNSISSNSSQNLFTPSSRPKSIQEAYDSATQTPVHIIRAIDSFRDDGRVGSKLFICQPVFTDTRKRVNFIDIETRRPSSLVLARELPREVIISRAKTPLCQQHNVVLNKDKDSDNPKCNNNQIKKHKKINVEDGSSLGDSNQQQNNANEQLYALPSPEEQMQLISKEVFPSKYVPIDVTGVGFTRMSSMRRSLIHTDFLIRRKKSPLRSGRKAKRRNTICESIKDLDQTGDGNRRTRIRRRSVGEIDFVNSSSQTENNENDIYNSGRVVTVKSMNKDKSDNNNNLKNNKIKLRAEVHHHNFESRSMDDLIDSNGVEQRSVGCGDDDNEEIVDHNETNSNRRSNRSSIRELENDRCKDVTLLPNFAVKMRENYPAKGTGDDGRSSSGNWSASSSTHASVDFEHNGPDKRGANHSTLKNDLPHSRSDSSLGKDSVISDSNTPTQDNDEQNSNHDTNGYSSDTSGFNGCHSIQQQLQMTKAKLENVIVRSQTDKFKDKNKVQYANRDSESWLQYFEHDNSSDNNTITPTESTTTPTESESGQTQTTTSTNHAACGNSRRSSFSVNSIGTNTATTRTTPTPTATPTPTGHHHHTIGEVDEVESVYSVDNDGYYTSMHTDSGLFRIPVKLMITPNSSFRVKGKRDSITSVTTVGDLSINSILSKTETESSTSTLTGTSKNSSRIKLPPPPPPPRVSSMLKTLRKANERANRHSLQSNSSNFSNGKADSSSFTSNSTSRSHSPSPQGTNSESDNSYQRFKLKTNIDSSMYPSMCALTSTEGSEDGKSNCDSSSNDGGSHRATPSSKFLKSSYKGFRIRDIFGFGKDSGRNTPVNNSNNNNSETLTNNSTTPHIATIRRPPSPFRFSMYGHNAKMRKFMADKVSPNNFQTPNIIRTNAISSFSSDTNQQSDDSPNDNKLNNTEKSNEDVNSVQHNNATTKKDTQNFISTDSFSFKSNKDSVPHPFKQETSSSLLSSSTKTPSTPTHQQPKQDQQKPVPFTKYYPVSRQVSPPDNHNYNSKINCQFQRSPGLNSNMSSSSGRPNSLPVTSSYSSYSYYYLNNGTATLSRLKSPNRCGARVTLDPYGEVIYASNSLGRRRDGHPMNYIQKLEQINEPVKLESKSRSATLPLACKNMPRVSSPLSSESNDGLVRANKNGYIDSINQKHQMMLSQNCNKQFPIGYHTPSGGSNGGKSAPSSRCTTPVTGLRSFTPGAPKNGGTFFQITAAPKSTSNDTKKPYIETDLNDETTPTSISLPTQNGDSKLNEESPNSPSTFVRNGKGRLSTNDLLILIHNSKKKHNIKTEPEIYGSLNSPPSSRSSNSTNSSSLSPGSINSPLSPKIASYPTSPQRTMTPGVTTFAERKSWSGNDNTANLLTNMNQPGYRRSLATDRLGPAKPTPINDFKRLLLQTRNSGFSERMSAAEMLRANSKRPLTPVVTYQTSFVNRTTPTPTSMKSPGESNPPQINGMINSKTPNLIKPKIINGRMQMTRMPYRHETILEEEKDDNNINGVNVNNNYITKSHGNSSPVIMNNYNRVAANPNSTSTWV